MKDQNTDMEKIAIIGMAGRFPGAGNIEQFWLNLRNGKDCVTKFSDTELRQRGVKQLDLDNPNYVKMGVVLENIDLFDPDFFGYNAREAELMDPQQRIFLEIAWEALENAGCNPDTFKGSIGVFGGTGSSDYAKRIPASQASVTSGLDSFQAMLGNDLDFLTTRVSYKLNLKGPSLTVQTACSTSLVAVHLACQNLLTNQCDLALAGGVSIRLPQGVGYTYHDGMLWSPDGYCRAFDAKAHGTIFGRGAGIVVLKRLSEAVADGDFIYAVIRGSAVNNDGSLKVGYTAPSIDGQAEVIRKAHAISGTPAETIEYIEAHGTGTKLGDPIEIEALTKAFRASTDKTGYCGIGSVKTSIGHLDVAAGIASLIKTALALNHGEIPPSLHFEKPNPDIDFDESPFFVVDRLRPWERNGRPRRAGVSSFGIGGTNAHVILEEAPIPLPSRSVRSAQLLVLSAKTQEALNNRVLDFFDFLKTHHDCSIADTAYTLQNGRKHFQYRKAIVCRDRAEAIETFSRTGTCASAKTTGSSRNKKIVFMFSGQGAQYINMCLGLYKEEPYFRNRVDECAENLKPQLGRDIRALLFPPVENEHTKAIIDETRITQPAIFVVEYCLAKLLMEWGVAPDAMVGHSIGEYVAACLAGVFSLKDALSLVAARGSLMHDVEPGAMLAVALPEDQLVQLLPDELDIAVVNAPEMSVVAGRKAHIQAFQEKLSVENGCACKIIHTSHAFHSRMMAPVVGKFEQLVASIERRKPEKRFASNLSGTWITAQQATSPEYWAQHLRCTVRFHECVTTLLEGGYRNFVEVGPGKTLTTLAARHQQIGDSLLLRTTRRATEIEDDHVFLLNTMGKLWVTGIDLNWNRVNQADKRRKIPLPSYPFQRKHFWIDNADQAPTPQADSGQETCMLPNRNCAIELTAPDMQTARDDLELQLSNIYCSLIGIPHVDVRENFFDLGGDSLLAVQLLAHLKKISDAEISLADIFEHATVESLSARIKQGGGRLRSTVISLNNSSSHHLIYFVVGIQLYQALAQCLEDTARSFGTFLPAEEALFGKGINAVQWTVQDLATAYREEIVRHCQGRPVSLIGVSFGGVVGYELARQLADNGISVPWLVMLDSLLPSGMHRDYAKWIAAQAKSAARSGVKPFLKKVKSKLVARTRSLRQQLHTIQVKDVVPDQRLAIYADAVDRFEKFSTNTTYKGRTLLIQAKDEPRYPGYTIDPHFGWEKRLSGEFHVDYAPGDHLGILRSPNVKVTADIIKRAWRETGTR